MGLGSYFSTVFSSVKSLLSGMKLTGYYFTHHKEILTQQYPENKREGKLVLPERFRGEVTMPHDENNEHRCTGCQSCELSCPNGSIKIITKQELQPDGKKKKAIDTWVYHLDMCTFCNLCIEACPTQAIVMGQEFEHSVFDKKKLKKILNQPDSKLKAGVE